MAQVAISLTLGDSLGATCVVMTGAAQAVAGGSITFGQTAIQPTDDSDHGNLIVQQATLAQAGMLQSLSFYLTAAAGRKLRLGVYDATGPSAGPGKLVSAAPEIAVLVVGWNTIAVTPVALAAGTYWLAFTSSLLGPGYKLGPGTVRWVGFNYGPMPATYFTGGLASGSFAYSFYGTVATGASGPQSTVSVVSSPADGGTVTGTGVFPTGSQQTLVATATPNTPYQFGHWADKDGNILSTSPSYTFTVTGDT